MTMLFLASHDSVLKNDHLWVDMRYLSSIRRLWPSATAQHTKLICSMPQNFSSLEETMLSIFTVMIPCSLFSYRNQRGVISPRVLQAPNICMGIFKAATAFTSWFQYIRTYVLFQVVIAGSRLLRRPNHLLNRKTVLLI